MKKEELRQKLKIKNPFEYFANQAYKFGKKIKLPVEFTAEALEIIKGAFSEQWLLDQLERKDREAQFLCLRQHPIANRFLSPSEADLVEIFELAIYIKRLIKCPNLDQVLKQMKSPEQYSTGLLQLAFAYRFLTLGVSNIRFEPEALSGHKGDIYFEIENIPYMVECFMPRFNYPTRTSLDLFNSVPAIFEAAKSVVGILRICIRLKKSIDHDERREIERTTKGLISKISKEKSISGEINCADISIEDISNLKEDNDFPKGDKGSMDLYGGADWGVNSQSVEVGKMQEVRDGTLKDKKRLSRIFVWEPTEEKIPADIKVRVDELTKKIEKKLSQTRTGNIYAKRIVIAQVGEMGQKDRDDYTALKKIQYKIVTSHRGVAALIIVSRAWMENFRYQYRGFFLMGREDDALSTNMINKWNELEQQGYALEDWR